MIELTSQVETEPKLFMCYAVPGFLASALDSRTRLKKREILHVVYGSPNLNHIKHKMRTRQSTQILKSRDMINKTLTFRVSVTIFFLNPGYTSAI